MHRPASNFPVPEAIRPALRSLPDCRIVGGAVRDHLMGATPKDIDIEVYGIDYQALCAALHPHGKVDLVGKSFGIAIFRAGSESYDFSIARRESKIGVGHKGFKVELDPTITPVDAARRRDFTMNSLAYDPETGQIEDHFGGIEDIERGILRHTSEAFTEDPLRVLRGFQFAGRFGMTAAPETAELCRGMIGEYETLASERISAEWMKWATKSITPSMGLTFLRETGWIALYPEIELLYQTPQDPEWHPEGDAGTHTGLVCDQMVKRSIYQQASPEKKASLMFAALTHDIAKPQCTSQKFKEALGRTAIISPGHDVKGGPAAREFLREKLGIPKKIVNPVEPLVVNHMIRRQTTPDDKAIKKLSVRMHPSSIEELSALIHSDCSGRPPLPERIPQEVSDILKKARELGVDKTPLKEVLQGKDIVESSVIRGQGVGMILEAAYDAQIKGEITDRESALKWYRENRARVLMQNKVAPERVITADDLKERGLSGPDLGKALNAAYEKQLDGETPAIEDVCSDAGK